MANPMLVNISGMRRAGVTVACDRVARSLNGMGFNTVVVKTSTSHECLKFSDDVVLGKYRGVSVVIFDKHFFTESAARRGLRNELWIEDDNNVPDLSILMTPDTSPKDRHKIYLKMPTEHYGTDNHHVISTNGKNGKLFAAGNIKALILREMRRA